MKETEMHRQFPNWEIRELIANDLRNLLYRGFENKIQNAKYDKDHIQDYIIEDSRLAIKFHKERIKIAEVEKGLKAICEVHGWEAFDISDELIQIEHGQKLYLNFIGTTAEHQKLLKIIGND